MLFSVVLHSFLLDFQKNHPSTRVLAYLDNMFFIGPMEDFLLCLNDAKSSLKEIGLNIAIEKCELLCNGLPDHIHLDIAIRVVSSGTITETCLEFAKGGQGLCDELTL